jgi:flagellar motor switch protein FliG
MSDAPEQVGDEARKATALLIAMGRPLAQRIVARFSEAELRTLSRAARALPPMNKAVIEALVEDFASLFINQSGHQSADVEINAILDEGFGTGAADRLNAAPTPLPGRTPRWPEIAAAEPERIAKALAGESDAVIAVTLGALPQSVSARLLAAIDPARRSGVTRHVLLMATPAASAVQAIEEEIHARLTAPDPKARLKQNLKRTAALLNALPRDDADALIDTIAIDDSSSALALKELIFSFEDIAKLDAKARVALLDSQPVDRLAAALRGADIALTEAVLGALGGRARRMVEAELQAGGADKPELVAAARRAVADAALSLAEEGRIKLPEAAP